MIAYQRRDGEVPMLEEEADVVVAYRRTRIHAPSGFGVRK
jgi:hypothetical protein